jgi:predicted transcriptional regulator
MLVQTGVLPPVVHRNAHSVYSLPVVAVTRINVSLDEAHALRLSQLAEQLHVQEGTVARSLLSQALDDLDPEPRRISDLLDRIPGARERIASGLADYDAGRTIPLDQL